MRQHVNPLSSFFQLPRELPLPDQLFEQPDLPIHLDIGSAKGLFLISLAKMHPQWNHVGLEIRRPLVQSAERERVQLGITNLRFLFCNANVSLTSWLSSLPKDRLQRVSIQFPDPWFKRRHQKRRLFQPELLVEITKTLNPGRELFIQSDLLQIIDPILTLLNLSRCFDINNLDGSPFLAENPIKVPTEREIYALRKGLPVYRLLCKRNNQPPPRLDIFE